MDREAARRSGTRARSPGGSSTSGIRTSIGARPVRDGGARPVHRRPRTTCRSSTCCSSCARTAASTRCSRSRGGSQENLVDGGAGSIAQRSRRRARRRGAPQRAGAVDHAARRPRGRRSRRRSSCRPAHVVVTVPPALVARDRVRSRCCPTTGCTLYRNAVAGPETKTLVVYDEPFWRADGLQRPDARSPDSASEVTHRRVARVGHARRASRRSRSGRSPSASTRSTRPSGATRVLDALDGPARPARRVTRRVHRDRVVEGGVDARLLDGAPPARASSPATARCSASRSGACTGPAPRPRPSRTARSTAPCAPASRAAAEILGPRVTARRGLRRRGPRG